MGQHQQDRTSKEPITANWDTLRVAHFDQSGAILALADKAKITVDAKKFDIDESLALPSAFTTLEAAEEFVARVIAHYSKNKFVGPYITGNLIEEKEYEGSTFYVPFVRVQPSPHAPGQPMWKGTLKVAEIISDAIGESPDDLRQHDGKYDTSHQRGRIMVNTQGHFQGIIFVGGNSLNVLFPPGKVWMVTVDGRMGEFGIK
jgi:hypothetical protein